MSKTSGLSVLPSVHGYSVLDLALVPVEASFALPLVHEIAGENDRAMLNIAVAAEINTRQIGHMMQVGVSTKNNFVMLRIHP